MNDITVSFGLWSSLRIALAVSVIATVFTVAAYDRNPSETTELVATSLFFTAIAIIIAFAVRGMWF